MFRNEMRPTKMKQTQSCAKQTVVSFFSCNLGPVILKIKKIISADWLIKIVIKLMSHPLITRLYRIYFLILAEAVNTFKQHVCAVSEQTWIVCLMKWFERISKWEKCRYFE